jgi:hypothetical protein
MPVHLTWAKLHGMWSYLESQRDRQALPRWRQALEMVVLFALRGIGPGYYVDGAWWRVEVSFADKWRHMNRREYRHFLARHNPAEYRKASQHKVVEKAVLQMMGLPTAGFVGFLHSMRGRTVDGSPLTTASDLRLLLSRHLEMRLCFKPVEGYGGHGVQMLDVKRDATGQLRLVHPVTGDVISVEDWLRCLQSDDGYLIEHALRQHPGLADINPSSLNTLRIWVYDRGASIEVAGAMLRVGRAGSQVDNTSSGGLRCPIDIRTGRIRFALSSLDGAHLLERHPDSGAPLTDREIPDWPSCQDLAARALAAFPHMRVAGLDVAVTPDGPHVIELNTFPDYVGCACMNLPLKRLDAELRHSAQRH